MKKALLPLFSFIIGLLPILLFAQTDGLPRGSYQMPYVRYEANAGSLGGGATLLGPTFDQKRVESEASDQVCASLSAQNSFVRWNLSQAGQGLVLRFSIPDGQTGSLALYVGGNFVQNINLTSKWAWQYFSPNPGDGTKDPVNTPQSGWTARMRFDEVRLRLSSSVPAGTEIRLQKTTGTINYLIDFIEMEAIQAPIAQPANSLSVLEYGAIPNDQGDDMQAFVNCLNAAKTQGRNIYIPAGRFLLGSQGGKWIFWQANNITVQGAGIWHTELYFSNPGPNSGGIEATGTNLRFRDFFMDTENTTRTAGYKGFTGGYGANSTIERVWVEHFEVGAWIANWQGSEVTDGMIITGCRFRNNYADGVNFSKGTKNSICEHSHFRNNGDDAMATWSSFDGVASTNNTFRYCTAENTWRAAGLGFFGGGGHKAHHLIIKDGTEAGLRVNSDFPGPEFSTTLWMEISETTVISCGTNANLWHNRYGAIDIFTRLYNLQNLRFRNVDILNSQKDAIMIYNVNSSYTISNLEFINVKIDGTGRDGNVNNYTAGTYDDYLGNGILINSSVRGSASMTGVTMCNIASENIYRETGATFNLTGTVGSCNGGGGVTGVTVTPNSATLAVNGTQQLNATVSPTNATNKNVTWSSSNTSIATVSSSGLVTGRAAGTVTITATTVDGGKTATSTITVTSGSVAVTGVSVSPTSASIAVGATQQLIATVLPTNATNKSVTWTSNNTAVATVSSTGLVTGVAAGTATITVRTADGGFTATSTITVTGGGGSLPAPWVTTNVGSVGVAGSASHSSGTYTVAGSGADIWGTADGFRFVYQPVTGDVTITARVASLQNTDGWAKAGVMVREGTAANARHLFTAVTPSNGLAFQRRTTTGGESFHTSGGAGAAPYWVRIVRSGNVFTSFVSSNGTTWTQIGSETITLPSTINVGLAVTSHNNSVASTATFTNVSVTTGGGTVAVTGVSVTPTSASIAVNATQQLTATVAPSNATNKNITWSSSNTAVATVSTTGLVTGRSAGTATITVTTQDGGRTATSTITVTSGGTVTSYRIKNRWQNTYLYDAGDRVRYSATSSGTTYQWVLEDVSGVKEIKNVATGEYMHIENLQGFIQCTPRTAGWMSSRWATEDAGSGFIRLRNVWQSNQYIHIENLQSQAQHGTIDGSWLSAQWVLEPVTGARVSDGKDENLSVVMSPNPVLQGILTISSEELSGNVQLVIRNAQGVNVFQDKTTVEGSSLNLDISKLKEGAYIIQINTNGRSFARKFIVK